ncbi:bifunctional phosphoribosylaminoimidazolecarboxamide formyltransferase/IMP cyclohydrolase [Candidatus Woesearchaeota archaeon]|nr:bifunctional phosphoribosylaminoimidazolecarboxamide formyltransferase/IMP cyclohydrolase [Candidatus Woesearchaeota archaeon]
MAKTALVSVSNKEGIVELARQLSKLGIKIISTGNTAKLLEKSKIRVSYISEITKFPEMLDGRVKSLHPNVFGGILADRSSKKHQRELRKLGIDAIDLVVVNFYPFEQAIRKNSKLNEIIENIDIGGPSIARAAAKNYRNVLIIVDPADYQELIERLKNKRANESYRMVLANKAFSYTASYDSIINWHFNGLVKNDYPKILNMTFKKAQDLRYGENPHQSAAFYRDFFAENGCVSTAKQLHGKELSYNNILDLDAAFELVKEFEEPAAAVVKHTNPSGVASSKKIEDAYKKAHEADPKSAFGCVVALNRNCNAEIARYMKPLFIEVLICPKFEKNAIDILKEKKNVRLLETGSIKRLKAKFDLRKVTGGILAQIEPHVELTKKNMKIVTRRKPTREETESLVFAWKVNKHVKSNSVVFAKKDVTVGIGAGQMSRVDAVNLAIMKNESRIKGSVMSSDAFFPFRDGVDQAARAGVTAIIQPGGSIRDEEVTAAANEHNLAMVFTGIRLFKH